MGTGVLHLTWASRTNTSFPLFNSFMPNELNVHLIFPGNNAILKARLCFLLAFSNQVYSYFLLHLQTLLQKLPWNSFTPESFGSSTNQEIKKKEKNNLKTSDNLQVNKILGGRKKQ